MNQQQFRIQKLDLDNHKPGFCRLLIDLHKHYFAESDLMLASVIDYFDSVLATHIDKYDVDICIDGDDTVVGFSACYESISFVELSYKKTRQLQLKELFVCEEYRNKGIGTLLMENVVRRARDIGCYRIDWNVRDWNESGIEFYKRIGAEFVKDRKSMRIEF